MALLVVTQIALILTLLTGYRPSFFPPGMEKRSIGFGAATAQILVDSPSSALADLSRDTAPLATRALVFTQFMSSFSFKESIAQAAGLHGKRITTEGPFTQIGIRPNVVQTPELPGDQGVESRYRLVFDAQDQLPVISVYAQAPTAKEARALANGAVIALQRYVARLQANDRLPTSDRVIIRSLGSAEGGTVNSGASAKLMVLTFVAVMLLGCALILAGVSFNTRRHREPPRAHGDTPLLRQPDSDEETEALRPRGRVSASGR